MSTSVSERRASTTSDRSTFPARGLFVGERIDVRRFDSAHRGSSQPVTVRLAPGGMAVLFRYGAVVFFDTELSDQQAFLRELESSIAKPYARPETEEVCVCVDGEAREGMDGSTVKVNDRSVERLQVVASALSKSVALAQYEAEVAENFEHVAPIAARLEQSGRGGRNMRKLLRHIGRVLLCEHNLVARVEVSARPEIIWDRPDLEQLYVRLEDELELRERDAILDRQLKLISQTVRTVLDLLQNRRSLRVEWYIVILILLEIGLTVYELFLRRI